MLISRQFGGKISKKILNCIKNAEKLLFLILQ